MKKFLLLACLALLPGAAIAATASQFNPNDSYDVTATVTVDTATSAAVDLYGTDLAGIFIPSTFDGTTITFTASATLGGTYVAVQDGAGNALTLTTTASRYVPISNLAQISGLRFIKLVCGTTQTTTDTVFTLALRPI